MRKFMIPEGTVSIKDNEFEYRTDLEEVVLPQSLKRIGSYAFAGSSLKCITFPDVLPEIGDYAFSGTCLESVEMKGNPEIPVALGKSLFRYCRFLTSVSWIGIPEVTKECFYDCVLLRELYLSKEVVEIQEKAFAGCIALKELVFPRNLKYISEGAFMSCTGIEQLDFPESLEKIERNAFFHCDSLVHAKLKQHIKFLGSRVFAGNTRLKEMELYGNYDNQEIFSRADMWSGCKELEKIIAPHIPVKAFYKDWRQAAVLGFAEYYISNGRPENCCLEEYSAYMEEEKQQFFSILLKNKALMQIFAEKGLIPQNLTEKLVDYALKGSDVETKTLLLDYQEKQKTSVEKKEEMEQKLWQLLDDLKI